jgi:hypothetical protein
VKHVGRQRGVGTPTLAHVQSRSPQPIFLYANSADFQQTTTTPELIGEGTGGFTDPFMNRVVLPLTGDYAENDHVLGHEMVHVFQFDIAASITSSRRRFNLEMMPLWIVEGMAEYFSKGRVDPLTSMWIRDAELNNRLPTLRQLERIRTVSPTAAAKLFSPTLVDAGDDAVVRCSSPPARLTGGFDRALAFLPNNSSPTGEWRMSCGPIVADRQPGGLAAHRQQEGE